MANKIFNSLVLSSNISKDEIISSLVSTINAREEADTANTYIAKVFHIYSIGENAGAEYFVVGDKFKTDKNLESNLIETIIEERGIDEEAVNILIDRKVAQLQLDNSGVDQVALENLIIEKIESKSTELNNKAGELDIKIAAFKQEIESQINRIKEEINNTKTGLNISDIIAFS